MKMHKIWTTIKEYFNEIFISIFFISIVTLIFWHRETIFTKDEFYKYATSFVALFGIFLAWLQFLFQKHHKKKEAALTYFPRPLELEKLENDIDAIINFWSRNDSLDNYEIKLMTGKEIDNDEYTLIWKKLSFENKDQIIKTCLGEECSGNYDYNEKYNVYINDLYRKARRKLNAYINQIEGYCLAINKGNIDLKSAKDLFAHKFYHNFRKARPYIELLRIDKNNNTLYIEFENVLKKWGSL